MHRYAKPTRCAVAAASVLAVLAVLVVLPAAAAAGSSSGSRKGALSRATSAVRQSTGAPSKPSSGSNTPSSPSDSHSHTHTYYPDYTRSCYTCVATVPGPPPSSGAPGAQARSRVEPPDVALDLALQSVEDSDGAAMGALRITKGWVGFGFAGTRYYESAPALDGSDTITMNIWTFTGLVRALRSGDAELWLSGGLGGASSTEFPSIKGPALGAALEYTLTPGLAARGSARYFVLEDGVRAGELRASVAASFIEAGYRVFRFHAGPALRGPEVGLALRF